MTDPAEIRQISPNFVENRQLAIVRVGKFVFDNEPAAVMAALERCLIKRIDDILDFDAYDCWAYSPDFPQIPRGQAIFRYQLMRVDGGLEINLRPVAGDFFTDGPA